MHLKKALVSEFLWISSVFLIIELDVSEKCILTDYEAGKGRGIIYYYRYLSITFGVFPYPEIMIQTKICGTQHLVACEV